VTERKPSGMSWETWIERQIREAQERGEFDDLAGSGRPLEGLHAPRDENWWIKKKLRDEQLQALPPALAIRHDRDRTMEQVTTARTEAEVRALLDALNQRIRRTNRTVTAGPSTSIGVIDVEPVVAAWRRARPTDPAGDHR
jgi:hypothetical protein